MDEVANNIVPLTGSPLSRRSRENISAQVTSFGSFINEQKNFNSQKSRADDYQNVLIQGGQTSVTSLQNQLDSISKEVSVLSQNVNAISQTIQQQGTTEQLRLRSEQENQRRLTERKIAVGREDELEQKIQSSLASPILSVQGKVTDLFSRVESAFTTLFLGWLSNSVIDYLKSQSEGDNNKLNQIKAEIVKGLGIGVASLVAVKTGLSLVGRAISSVVGSVTGLIAKLASMPFRALGAGIRALGSGGKPSAPRPGGKPGGKPGIGSGIGKFATFLSSLMNFNNKEYIDGVLSALSLASRAPGALGAIGKIAGVAFTVDEIAEVLGKNIFGDERDKKVQEIAEAVTGKKAEDKSTPAQQTPSKAATSAKPSSPSAATLTPQPSSTVTSPKVTGQPSQTNTAKVQPSTMMAPQVTNLSMNMSSPAPAMDAVQRNASATTESSAIPSTSTQQQFKDYSAIFSSTKSEDKGAPKIAPAAQVTPPPKDPNKVGALPEVKPQVIVATDTNTTPNTQQSPSKTPPNPEVPVISSSNPDNFYVLYSQMNYNVVM